MQLNNKTECKLAYQRCIQKYFPESTNYCPGPNKFETLVILLNQYEVHGPNFISYWFGLWEKGYPTVKQLLNTNLIIRYKNSLN